MSLLQIRPIHSADQDAVQLFCDREIGKGYFSGEQIALIIEQGTVLHDSEGEANNVSFVLEESDKNQIVGVRLTLPPGNWIARFKKPLSPNLWPVPAERVAYFQSLFIAKPYQGKGWGPRLSVASMQVLKKAGAQGIVCHSWLESPNNSSMRYLESLGFKQIAQHKNFWQNTIHHCPLCLTPPCRCTGVEMFSTL